MSKSSRTLCAALVFACAASGNAEVVDLNGLSHGTNVRDQFVVSDMLQVRGVNYNKPVGNAMKNMAVIFDTANNPNLGDDDNDLRSPWDGGNLPANHFVGKVLIIQERTKTSDVIDSDNDGIPEGVHVPDDEGRRPAGKITLTWLNDCAIESIAFTLVDVEIPSEPFSVRFGNGVDSVTLSILNGVDYGYGAVAFGNNSANRLGFSLADVGIDQITVVEFEFGGSGGVGEIEYSKRFDIPEVPTPAALPAGAALLALAAVRRRHAH